MIEREVLDQTSTESTAPIRPSSNRPSNRVIGYFAYAACARTRRRWTTFRCANSAILNPATHANLAARWETWRGEPRTLTCGAGAVARGKRILTRSPNTSGWGDPSSQWAYQKRGMRWMKVSNLGAGNRPVGAGSAHSRHRR